MKTTTTKPSQRQRLATLLRATNDAFTVNDAAEALDMPNPATAKLLARWAKRGYLTRLRRGLYIPVPAESVSGDTVPDDPWTIATTVFIPCYIGGYVCLSYSKPSLAYIYFVIHLALYRITVYFHIFRIFFKDRGDAIMDSYPQEITFSRLYKLLINLGSVLNYIARSLFQIPYIFRLKR